MSSIAMFLFRAAIALPFGVGTALPGAIPDPAGVLLKPIPDKLIVLTFDDAPASHATVVAPILKEMGSGGTMYVCDFDSFISGNNIIAYLPESTDVKGLAPTLKISSWCTIRRRSASTPAAMTSSPACSLAFS